VLGSACAVVLVVMAALPSMAAAAPRPATHTHPLIGVPGSLGVHPDVGDGAVNGTSTSSYNWSGYDDSTDGPFTSVTATWTQPRVRVSGANVSDGAFWVGLDGDGSDTVEQIGTEGYSEGVAGYDAWYEMYPNAPVAIDMAVHPGDVFTGTVTCSPPATFTLSLVNHTTGATFTRVVTMTTVPALSSAEIIAEAPSDGMGDVLTISNFGLVQFSDCAIDGQPIAAYDWNKIDMLSMETDGLVTKASDLGADGASFWVTTDVTPPTTSVSGAGAQWRDKPVTLRFRATDNRGGQGVAYTEYSLDGGATWTKGDAVTVPAPRDHSNDGEHWVYVRSADKVGNVERKHGFKVLIDTRGPTVLAKWAATAQRGARTALSFCVADPRPGSPTATVTIALRNARGVPVKKLVVTGCRVGRKLACEFTCWLPKGRYSFRVTATDAAGNAQVAAGHNTLVVR